MWQITGYSMAKQCKAGLEFVHEELTPFGHSWIKYMPSYLAFGQDYSVDVGEM